MQRFNICFLTNLKTENSNYYNLSTCQCLSNDNCVQVICVSLYYNWLKNIQCLNYFWRTFPTWKMSKIGLDLVIEESMEQFPCDTLVVRIIRRKGEGIMATTTQIAEIPSNQQENEAANSEWQHFGHPLLSPHDRMLVRSDWAVSLLLHYSAQGDSRSSTTTGRVVCVCVCFLI